MLNIIDVIVDEKWDQRHWDVALKSDKPVDVYSDIKANLRAEKEATNVDDLPPEQRDWYRST